MTILSSTNGLIFYSLLSRFIIERNIEPYGKISFFVDVNKVGLISSRNV